MTSAPKIVFREDGSRAITRDRLEENEHLQVKMLTYYLIIMTYRLILVADYHMSHEYFHNNNLLDHIEILSFLKSVMKKLKRGMKTCTLKEYV